MMIGTFQQKLLQGITVLNVNAKGTQACYGCWKISILQIQRDDIVCIVKRWNTSDRTNTITYVVTCEGVFGGEKTTSDRRY